MKKIRNPFNPELNKCFGCSPTNPVGLKLEFFEEEELLTSYWDPVEYLQGFPDVVHGGIQSTLMDELASWIVFVKIKTVGFTSGMEIRFIKPLLVSKGSVKVTGKLVNHSRRIAEIETHIYNADGVECARGKIKYFTFPSDEAHEKMGLPDHDKFYND